MNPKMPRPGAPGRAHRAANSKELGGTFSSQSSEEASEPQDSAIPIAHSRIVVGRTRSFIYIEYCPLCGLEHTHGEYRFDSPYNDPSEAFESCNGHRASHCGPHGLGRTVRRIGGEWCNVYRDPPPEYHEPNGESYRLVMAYPACFTPLGIKSKAARHLMDALTRRGVPTSLEILKPRRKFVLRTGDLKWPARLKRTTRDAN